MLQITKCETNSGVVENVFQIDQSVVAFHFLMILDMIADDKGMIKLLCNM